MSMHLPVVFKGTAQMMVKVWLREAHLQAPHSAVQHHERSLSNIARDGLDSLAMWMTYCNRMCVLSAQKVVSSKVLPKMTHPYAQ